MGVWKTGVTVGVKVMVTVGRCVGVRKSNGAAPLGNSKDPPMNRPPITTTAMPKMMNSRTTGLAQPRFFSFGSWGMVSFSSHRRARLTGKG